MPSRTITISTVTPVYGGADYLPDLVAALDALRSDWEQSAVPFQLVESIFVIDEAIDESAAVLERLCETHDWVRVIVLSRNFGQHAATMAGVLHSSGDWVATLDEDLQHHPRHLDTFLTAALEQSRDIVYARPASGPHQSTFRDGSSRMFKNLMARLSGNPSIRRFNSFRLVRGDLFRAAASVAGYDIYLDLAIQWFGNRMITIEVETTDERYVAGGKSGYSLARLLHHARQLLVSSNPKLIRIGGLVGLATMVGAFVLAGVYLAVRLFKPEVSWPPGWASLILSNLFFGGVICLMLAVLLEYLGIVLLKAQGKPSFFVIDRSKDAVWTGRDNSDVANMADDDETAGD